MILNTTVTFFLLESSHQKYTWLLVTIVFNCYAQFHLLSPYTVSLYNVLNTGINKSNNSKYLMYKLAIHLTLSNLPYTTPFKLQDICNGLRKQYFFLCLLSTLSIGIQSTWYKVTIAKLAGTVYTRQVWKFTQS